MNVSLQLIITGGYSRLCQETMRNSTPFYSSKLKLVWTVFWLRRTLAKKIALFFVSQAIETELMLLLIFHELLNNSALLFFTDGDFIQNNAIVDKLLDKIRMKSSTVEVQPRNWFKRRLISLIRNKMSSPIGKMGKARNKQQNILYEQCLLPASDHNDYKNW